MTRSRAVSGWTDAGPRSPSPTFYHSPLVEVFWLKISVEAEPFFSPLAVVTFVGSTFFNLPNRTAPSLVRETLAARGCGGHNEGEASLLTSCGSRNLVCVMEG